MDEGKIPKLTKPNLHISSRFLYDEWVRLSHQLEEKELEKEQREAIESERSMVFKRYETASDREQSEPEMIGQECLVNLKYAVEHKDVLLLKKVVLAIQEFVNRPNKNKDLNSIRFGEDDLKNILNNDIAIIPVGSGTFGQRILISSKNLRMNGDKYGQEYRVRFAKFFGLKFDPEVDLVVEF